MEPCESFSPPMLPPMVVCIHYPNDPCLLLCCPWCTTPSLRPCPSVRLYSASLSSGCKHLQSLQQFLCILVVSNLHEGWHPRDPCFHLGAEV